MSLTNVSVFFSIKMALLKIVSTMANLFSGKAEKEFEINRNLEIQIKKLGTQNCDAEKTNKGLFQGTTNYFWVFRELKLKCEI